MRLFRKRCTVDKPDLHYSLEELRAFDAEMAVREAELDALREEWSKKSPEHRSESFE
jgi:hypothetical protein